LGVGVGLGVEVGTGVEVGAEVELGQLLFSELKLGVCSHQLPLGSLCQDKPLVEEE